MAYSEADLQLIVDSFVEALQIFGSLSVLTELKSCM